LTIDELFEITRNGGKADEERLFEALSVRFRLFAYRRIWEEEEALEIVQDALMKIASQYRNIVFRTSFAAWAYKVLINEIRNYVRKRKRRGETASPGIEHESMHGSFVADPALLPQLLDCLRRLARRNLRYARILNLKYQGYKAEDICERMIISPNNLYVILSRARIMLKNCLERGVVE